MKSNKKVKKDIEADKKEIDAENKEIDANKKIDADKKEIDAENKEIDANKKNIEEDIPEKKIKKDTEDELSKEVEKKQNSQFAWIFIVMAISILLILSIPTYSHFFVNNFNYNDLKYSKVVLTGNFVVYSTSIPVADNTGRIVDSYNMSFRSNPKDLETIQLDVPNEEILLLRSKELYISLDPNMDPCPDSSVSIYNFANFLRGFALKDVKSGVFDKEYADEKGIDYITCSNRPKSTVITITSGNETKIVKTSNNCYEMTYSNCQINPVTEKYIQSILKNYMDLLPKTK